MAYAATVTGPIEQIIGGRRYYTWTIAETEVQTTSSWSLTHDVGPCTVTLLETEIETAGGVSTVQPELCGDSGFDSDSLEYIDQASVAGASVRITSDRRAYCTGEIHGRTNPDANGTAANAITTRLTVVEGHLAS